MTQEPSTNNFKCEPDCRKYNILVSPGPKSYILKFGKTLKKLAKLFFLSFQKKNFQIRRKKSFKKKYATTYCIFILARVHGTRIIQKSVSTRSFESGDFFNRHNFSDIVMVLERKRKLFFFYYHRAPSYTMGDKQIIAVIFKLQYLK